MAAASNQEKLLSLLAQTPDGMTDGANILRMTTVPLNSPSLSACFIHPLGMLSDHFGAGAMQSLLPVLKSLMMSNRLNAMQLESGGTLFKLVEEEVRTWRMRTPFASLERVMTLTRH